MSDVIFHITGGLGKHVLATSVVNSYKKTFPYKRIIVSSAYPDVFSRNPSVDESLLVGSTQYFYRNYIHGKDVEIFAQEPYKQTSHILKKCHLSETWCDMIGIKKIANPSIHFNHRELEIATKMVESYQDKPIIIFQPFGGPINQQIAYSWARDIHPTIAQEIVNLLKDKYNILHICNPHHPKLTDTLRLEDRMDIHVLFALLSISHRRILIDSCLQHAAYAMNLKSMVFWGITSPIQFGYNFHNNILPEREYILGTSNSYLFDYEIGGNISECPYSNFEDMRSIEYVRKLIKNNF